MDSEDVAKDPPPGKSRSGWTRGRIIFLSLSGLLLVGMLAWVSDVLLPFILACIIAYVLTPLVALAERIRVPRSLAIILVYAVTFSTLYGATAAIAPRIYDETVKLARDAPTLARDLAQHWGPRIEGWVETFFRRTGRMPEESPADEVEPAPAFEIIEREDGSYGVEIRSGVNVIQEGSKRWKIVPSADEQPEQFSVKHVTADAIDRFFSYVKRNALQLIMFGQVIVSTIARGIFLLFMTLMVAAYLIHTREHILGFFRSLPPAPARPSFDRLLWRMDRGVAGVVRGQLLICLVNGVLSAIGFWIFDLKYWPILAIIAGVMSLIPIFGSILSTIPAVLIGLTQDFWTAFWVLIWIVGIHQVEANLLNPKIIGVSARIHPVIVVFVLIVGEHFFGLWGALLAVPTWSVVQSLFNHFRFESLPDAVDTAPPPEVVPKSAPSVPPPASSPG